MKKRRQGAGDPLTPAVAARQEETNLWIADTSTAAYRQHLTLLLAAGKITTAQLAEESGYTEGWVRRAINSPDRIPIAIWRALRQYMEQE